MVGFLRKKKSDKVMLGDDTVLERKGKVDGSSLLDDNGDPANTTLYNQNRVPLKKGGRKGSDEENNAPPPHANGQQYPPANYPYGHTYPPQHQQPQHSGAFGGQSNGYGGSFNNSRGSFGQPQQQQTQQYPVQYGHSQPQPQQQQYPVQYGSQPQYGNNQSSLGNNNQPQYGQQPQYGNNQSQYPVQYGNYPPPQQQQPTKKSSFFRIPGYGKK